MRGPLATLIALAVFTSTAKAADIDAATKASNKQAIEFRHLIHANPELSNQEFETAELVATHLRSLGMDVKTGVAKTGVIGVLRGGKPGPVVAVRADMDALPVVERTNLPFKSTKRTTYLGQEVGVAHACGHDIHVAVGLGTATALASMRDDLPGTVKFIFQPAEEGVPPGEKGGASFMVEEGALERPRPDAIFALHSFPDFEVGEIGFTSGPTYASSDHFIIQIHGKQAHGAWPHLSVDPVVMASEVVQALQTIRSRNMHPRTAGVVSVGIIRGGERFNIIPEAVELQGTVRAYSEEVQDMVEARMPIL
ncbi:MAG: amidohydrolase, partial [Gammaproteobacteria bacterium]|nr:amidohydrolase [Gammaproteobacteria bacterium]